MDSKNPSTVYAQRQERTRWFREAGQRYAVITAKNHDGFCLFDSRLTEFKAINTPAGRDLIAEFVEAFRAEGLSVGFYYSLLDWDHDDYPHFGDRAHPMRDEEAFRGKKHDFPRYVDYLHGQIRELLTNYGKVKRVRRLSDGAEIIPVRPVQAARYADDLIIRSDRATLPDDRDAVVLLELTEPDGDS